MIRTLREKRMEFPLNKYKEIDKNTKIYVTCIEQDLNLAPPHKQTQKLPLC